MNIIHSVVAKIINIKIIFHLGEFLLSELGRDVDPFIRFTLLPLLLAVVTEDRWDSLQCKEIITVSHHANLHPLLELLHLVQDPAAAPTHRPHWRPHLLLLLGFWSDLSGGRVNGLNVVDIGQILLRVLSATSSLR